MVSKGKLLLVEDDPASRTALRFLLSRQGWSVTTAITVAQAMQNLLTSTPDVIVLDLMLPDGDGADVLRAVRSAGLPTRVAVVTGSNDRDRIARIRELQPTCLLFKPIALNDLLSAIQ